MVCFKLMCHIYSEQQCENPLIYCAYVCLCVGACVCALPPGGGGLLQHPEGVWLPLCEEGAHLCEGQRRTAHIFSEGKRQTRLIYQRFIRHAATPGGGQLRTTHRHTHAHRLQSNHI